MHELRANLSKSEEEVLNLCLNANQQRLQILMLGATGVVSGEDLKAEFNRLKNMVVELYRNIYETYNGVLCSYPTGKKVKEIYNELLKTLENDIFALEVESKGEQMQ